LRYQEAQVAPTLTNSSVVANQVRGIKTFQPKTLFSVIVFDQLLNVPDET